MAKLLKRHVDAAIKENNWDIGNKVLYDMCEEYPSHKNNSEIVAKVWLIGRSYAAAIERRKIKGGVVFKGDDFYFERVAPEILGSDIDKWLNSLNGFDYVNKNNLGHILDVHLKVTELFSHISGMDKRSLASKYLHFHFPKLFFIYDSRVVRATSQLKGIAGRVGKSKYESDNEYRKTCEKCLRIRDHVEEVYQIWLAPRNLDNLLLQFSNIPKAS